MGVEAVRSDLGAVSGAVSGAVTNDAPAPLIELRGRVAPTTLARSRTLPVAPELGELLPDGVLVRGTVVQVGSTSLAFALTGAPTRAGSWLAAVGGSSLGWMAAHEHGVVLERTIVVPEVPLEHWSTVVAALLDGVDLLVLSERPPLADRDARRLCARLRERGAVVLLLPSVRPWWPVAADLCLEVAGCWSGVEDGHGRLGRRHLTVTIGGRRGASRSRRVDLVLP
jgi:hypothetical protein